MARGVSTVLLVLCGCGPGVYSVNGEGAPLATLHADVVTQAPSGAPSTGLRAAVLWASLPEATERCLGAAASAADVVACAGTDFRPHLTSVGVPVQPVFPAAIELPLRDVPPLEALSPSRFGYGLLVVLSDGNANGALDLVPADEAEGPDLVLGTSLTAGSDLEGDYLGYREREVPPAWAAFRLLAGCGEVPRGFFVMRLSRQGDALTCALEPAEAPFTVALSGAARVRAHACQYQPPPLAAPPPAAPPPSQAALQCWGSASLEVVAAPGATCRRVQRFDLGAAPAPSWWPCGGDPPLLQLTAAHAPLTAGVDVLFSLAYLQGGGRYRLGDFKVKVGGTVLTTLDSTVIVGRPAFVNDDRDGDGLYSAGDTLEVSERDGELYTAPVAGPVAVEVWAESDGRVSPLGGPLSWAP